MAVWSSAIYNKLYTQRIISSFSVSCVLCLISALIITVRKAQGESVYSDRLAASSSIVGVYIYFKEKAGHSIIIVAFEQNKNEPTRKREGHISSR